jgi:hypothetical protein
VQPSIMPGSIGVGVAIDDPVVVVVVVVVVADTTVVEEKMLVVVLIGFTELTDMVVKLTCTQ